MPANNGNYDLVKDWIRENGTMPNGDKMPKRKMARMIYKEHGLNFTDEEHVRVVIQRLTGKGGKTDDVKVDADLRDDLPANYNPYNLPDTKEEEYEPYKLVAKKTLILSDIHFQFHSIPAIEAALNHGKKGDYDAILLNGDVMDFHGLSKFLKDPKKKSFSEELDMFRQFADMIKVEFPKAKLYYKLGNHDERYQHFLWMKSKELDGVPEFDFENILQARSKGITVISDKRIILVNDFAIMHGHEFAGAGYSPVSPARSLFNRAVRDSAQGHNHQTSESRKSVMGGRQIITYSMGCLCGLTPQWMPNNNHNHGFGEIEADINGTEYEFTNRTITPTWRVK